MRDAPNVVLVTTDQQRADLCAREGYPLDTTPFMDALAAEGTWFDRAYCPYPVCCPSRVSFLTGRFPSATGIRDNGIDDPPRYEQDLFDLLNAAGYETALCGKNHSHLDASDADYWYETSHWGGSPRTDEEAACDEWLAEHDRFGLEPNPYPPAAQPGGRAVGEALAWLSEASEPFFVWLSIPEPHPPYHVPEPYFSTFPPESLPPIEAGTETLEAKGFEYEWSGHLCAEGAEGQVPDEDYEELLPRIRSLYHGMYRFVDDQVERFVSGLADRGYREETLLIAHSDHGDYAGQYGTMRKGAGLDDALARVPLLVTGPGVEAEEGAHPAHVSLVDLLPTICEAIGTEIPAGVQGRSLWPLLTGAEYPEREFESVYAEVGYGGLPYDWADDPSLEANHLGDGVSHGTCNTFTQAGVTRMVRSGDWKLLADARGEHRLYDLEADPSELRDRYDDASLAEIRQELLETLTRWLLRTEDELPDPPRYAVKRHPRNYRWASPDGE